MNTNCYDPTFLWSVTLFTASFAQGKTSDEINFWAAVFSIVGDQLALLSLQDVSSPDGAEEMAVL